MHQRQRVRSVSRLLWGATAAVVSAALAVVVMAQDPVCFYLEPGSIEWYLFWCWLTG